MNTTVAEIRKLYQDNMLLPSIQSINQSNLYFNHYEDGREISLGPGLEMLLQYSAAEVLTRLPPELVHGRFGLNAAIWSWLNTVKGTVMYDEYHSFVSENIGKPKDIVAMSKDVTCHCADYKLDAGAFFRNCVLLEEMENGLSGLVDLEALLLKFAKPDAKLSNKRIKDYSLEFIRPKISGIRSSVRDNYGFEEKWGAFKENDRRYEVYMDGPMGFALMYKGRPNAITSFMAVNHETIKITQLQGVNPTKLDKCGIRMDDTFSARGLMPLEWGQLLVGTVMDAAMMLNYKQVCLQGAQNNFWVKPGAFAKKSISLERAREKYDKVAEKMMFSQGADSNWHLTIA
ncbi:MAG: hypothetical protein V1906_01010 [Candidatus Woesearchaeota archaeon]